MKNLSPINICPEKFRTPSQRAEMESPTTGDWNFSGELYSTEYNSERGASTFQLIALVAVVLILITAAYTTISNRSGELDAANNAWMDNQVQLWRENANPGPRWPGMQPYYWNVSNGNASGGNNGGGSQTGGTSGEPSEEKPTEEECDKGFWKGAGAGIKDMLTGLWDLVVLLWDVIFDYDSVKDQLGAMAEQIKELADGLWSAAKKAVWLDKDGAIEELTKVLESVFPEIAEALERECYGEAAGRLTVEVATLAASFTKTSKLLKLFDNLPVGQLIKYLDGLTPGELLKKLDELSDAERKALRDKLSAAGAPCRLLGAFGNSFSADTLVMTPDGLVAIGTIGIGDLVLAYHEETGEVGAYPVSATMRHLDPKIVLLTIEDELIETTPEHPFYVMKSAPWLAEGQLMGQWVVAEELELGDDIRSLGGSTGDVMSVEVVSVDKWMYNLTVEVAHTFFVGDGEWLVHNAGCLTFGKNVISKFKKHSQQMREVARREYDIELGKKVGTNTQTQAQFKDLVQKIVTVPSEIRTGTYRVFGSIYEDAKWYRSAGGDGIVVTTADGQFITFLQVSKGGGLIDDFLGYPIGQP